MGNRVSTDSKPAIEYREDLTRRGHTCQLSLCRASIAHILPRNTTRRIYWTRIFNWGPGPSIEKYVLWKYLFFHGAKQERWTCLQITQIVDYIAHFLSALVGVWEHLYVSVSFQFYNQHFHSFLLTSLSHFSKVGIKPLKPDRLSLPTLSSSSRSLSSFRRSHGQSAESEVASSCLKGPRGSSFLGG